MKPWLRVPAMLLLFVIMLSAAMLGQAPKREFRGAWIATVTNLDWPTRGAATQTQKDQLTSLLDALVTAGINAVIFQVRPECDALYASPYEPWSYWLTGSQGTAPSPWYDPLEFAVEEAHKRGMEIHAWFNPYRAYRQNNTYPAAAQHVTKLHPEWIITCPDGYKILDPGLPQTRDFVSMVISDVVRRYDVDGVHMDDYFYPYSEHGFTNEDALTFQTYPRGFTSVHDWRRDNVNLLVRQVYDSLQAIKPWVKAGMSPFGIWKSGVPAGIFGMSSYDVIYCDAIAWLQDQSIDYLTPQLYWAFGGGQDFGILQQWWSDSAAAHGRHLYPGHAIYRWSADEIANQVAANRSNPNVQGSVHFRANNIRYDTYGNGARMINDLYRTGAAIPVMPWKETTPPEAPQNLITQTDPVSGLTTLSWNAPVAASDGDTAARYLVYRVSQQNITAGDLDEGANVLAVAGMTSFIPSARIDAPNDQYSFAVSALDRNNNESAISNIVSISASVSAPVLASPIDMEPNVTKTSRLVWNRTAGALLFRVQVSSDASFHPDSLLVDRTTTDTSTTLPTLEAQAWYHWRVMSGSQGASSDFSASRQFRTGWPVPPTIIAPNAVVNTVHTPTFTWSGVGATSYRLQVVNDVTKAVVINIVTSDSSYTPSTPLLSYTIYTWTVRAINTYGESDLSAEGRFRTKTGTSVADGAGTPAAYGLAHNYPNPFNSSTQLQFSLPDEGPISLRIYNMLGQEVAVVLDRVMPAGTHVLHLDASRLPTGTYIAVMNSTGGRFTQRMILLK